MYEVTTIGKSLFTTTNLELAKEFFHENKRKFNYIELKEVTDNGKFYYAKSIAINYQET